MHVFSSTFICPWWKSGSDLEKRKNITQNLNTTFYTKTLKTRYTNSLIKKLWNKQITLQLVARMSWNLLAYDRALKITVFSCPLSCNLVSFYLFSYFLISCKYSN
jgi:hypothetical protein